jgi:signal transduction histidine kinase
MRSLGITVKLTLILVVFAALLLATISVLAYTSGSNSLQAAAISELLSTAIYKQTNLDSWIGGAQVHTTALASAPDFQKNLVGFLAAHSRGDTLEAQTAHADLIAEMKVWMGEGQDFLGWLIMDPISGQVIASTTPGEEGKFREDQAYFINGKNGSYVQNVYYSPSAQSLLITISAPIHSSNGELLGVLATNLDPQKMNSIISQRTGLRQSDDAFLVNASELFVTQPRFISDPAILSLGVHTVAVKNCLQHNGSVVSANDYRNIPALIVYRWLPERQLCLIVKMDRAEALAPVNALGNLILLISGIALLIASLLAYWLARSVTIPIQKLVQATIEIGSGKLNTNIEVKSKDEIGQLANAFSQMTKNLKKTLVSRDDLLAEVKERKKAGEKLARALVDVQRSNKELEQFAYVASHDLQEPLRMVSSYTQLLAQRYADQLDEKALKYINYAVDGAVRMQGLINDLLTYSRINTRGQPLELIDTHAILGEAIRNLFAAIEENRAIITNDDLPTIRADPTQLLQVFQNLVANAIKFHGKNPPRVHVSVQDMGNEWKFSVKDNGLGIDNRYADKLFVIFSRLHTREEYPGTGIGLAICKRIVERHGGRIWFESKLGKGSTFYFSLPKDKEKMK